MVYNVLSHSNNMFSFQKYGLKYILQTKKTLKNFPLWKYLSHMKGEFIIFLLRFVIISQRRRTQFLSKISSLPTFFVAPFLDYSAPLKSCIPKIAMSQLSWALKFHSASKPSKVTKIILGGKEFFLSLKRCIP